MWKTQGMGGSQGAGQVNVYGGGGYRLECEMGGGGGGVGAYSNQAQAVTGNVKKWVDKCSSDINATNKLIEDLTSRLSPILLPDTGKPATPVGSEPATLLCGAAQTLMILDSQIQHINSKLNAILHLIDL